MGLAFDYSRRDEEYILAHLKQRASTLTDGKWSSFLDSDIGYAIVKAVVVILNFIAFLCDQNVAECFLSTCLTREATVRKAKELGYIPDLANPATCQVRIKCPAFGEILTIPANTAWLVGGKAFTCLDEVIIPAGQTSIDITLTQGSAYQPAPITATGVTFFKVGAPRNLASLKIMVDGEEWTLIDSFIRPSDPKAVKRYEDILGQTFCFGANLPTYAPQAGQIIQVSGVLTDGKAGNIESSDALVKLVSIIRNSAEEDITNSFTATMLTSALGGTDVESIESIKANAPKFFSAHERAVTEADHEAIVKKIPGVKSVKAIGGEKFGRLGYVKLVIYGESPYSVTEDLKSLVLDIMSNYVMLTVKYLIEGPVVLEAQLDAFVGMDPNTSINDASAATAITNATTQYVNSLGVGKDLHLSALSAENQKTAGLTNVDFTAKLISFATSEAGSIVIPLIKNYDLSAAELRLHSDGTLLWSGDGTSKVVKGSFTHSVSGLADQRVDLIYRSLDRNNVDVQPEQIVWLTSLATSAKYQD